MPPTRRPGGFTWSRPQLRYVRRYNQYDSFALPLAKWLEQRGVTIQHDTRVTNVEFDITHERKVARRIEWIRGGKLGGVDLTANDLVFVTNGSCVENSSWGDHHTRATFDPEIREGSIWALWRNVAKQDPAFGRPDKFCTHTDQSSWMCLTTLDAQVSPYMEKIMRLRLFPHNARAPHVRRYRIETRRGR
jgi:oleate hydratase